jgi:sugar O-acyltransferase (sialic acid O-acetyltransferase NeuD family)
VSDVVIFGVGDFARVAHVYLRDDSEHDVVAFTAHGEHVDAREFRGLPLVPYEEIVQTHPPDRFAMFVAIGFRNVNRARAEIYADAKSKGYELVSYVSSRAMRSAETQLGDNCFVFEANVIQPFVELGDDVILWSGNHIGHDSRIEDHCFIASHVVVSGNVVIGHHSFVGVNATFRDGITVAPHCVIGAGALVMADTAEGDVLAPSRTKPRELRSWELEGF